MVRQPFKSQRTGITITTGLLKNGGGLTIGSSMPDKGVIFSDGIRNDPLKFNAGAIATIGIARERARLVIP